MDARDHAIDDQGANAVLRADRTLINPDAIVRHAKDDLVTL